jgi:hypothetical protein
VAFFSEKYLLPLKKDMSNSPKIFLKRPEFPGGKEALKPISEKTWCIRRKH